MFASKMMPNNAVMIKSSIALTVVFVNKNNMYNSIEFGVIVLSQYCLASFRRKTSKPHETQDTLYNRIMWNLG